jgi:hypothetical protein
MANSTLSYKEFFNIIFESPNLSPEIQEHIKNDLLRPYLPESDLAKGNQQADENSGSDDKVTKNSEKLLKNALASNYGVVTRFVPPYCATVTFYKNTLGFVSVSSLNPEFNSNVKEFQLKGKDSEPKSKYISIGAINTLAQAYKDAKQLES